MFAICGYDFCRDINSLNPSPVNNASYNLTRLENGIFSHWYVTKDVDSPYSSEEPTVWDYLTVMDANFNGTLEAGNVGYLIQNIDGIKVKRRIVGEYDWITLKYLTIEELCDNFVGTFKSGLLKRISKNMWLLKDCEIIYGAIWTDKGLIFVAKMNDEGELELL